MYAYMKVAQDLGGAGPITRAAHMATGGMVIRGQTSLNILRGAGLD